MNPTHIHLLLNHIPIIGTAFGIILLTYGIIIKSKSVINAALLSFIVISLFTIPVFITGEPAEESVENIAGINKSSIEEHEEAAEFSLWMMEALGILSLITYLFHKKDHSLGGKLAIVSLLFSLVTFGLMAKTGSEGGKIRHTELSNQSQATGTVEGEGENEDH
jgi:uncharacterized membrane protein